MDGVVPFDDQSQRIYLSRGTRVTLQQLDACTNRSHETLGYVTPPPVKPKTAIFHESGLPLDCDTAADSRADFVGIRSVGRARVVC